MKGFLVRYALDLNFSKRRILFPETVAAEKIIAVAWGTSSGQKLSLQHHFSPGLGLA